MARELTIGGFRIDDDSDCFIIAEVGHNHQGDIEKCKELFLAAKECGCHAVKLQKRSNRTLFTRDMYESAYDNENSYGDTYGSHREALEFGWDEYQELKRYCAEIQIIFFATAFDFESADFLMKLDVPAFKIASGDLTNLPLIKYVAGFGRPVVMSTGGGTMEDVQRAYDAAMPINPQITILQCTAGYPPDFDQLNLRTIETFREAFPNIVIGLSAHDSGIAMAPAAYVLGARILEKHFTLNRAWKGTDHAFSLERPGMRRLVRDLQRTRIALGDGQKRQYPTEKKPLFKMAKKLVAARDLAVGHQLTREDIAIRSPNDGLPPYELENVIGKVLKRSLTTDENLGHEDLE